MTRRAYISSDELPASATTRHVLLSEDASHRIADVLRMQPGDALELFDGTGRLLDGRIQEIRDGIVRVAILDDTVSTRGESPIQLELCAAIPKGDRWRWLLEKATELGVTHVSPLETDRGVVEIPDDKIERKLKRWHRIAIGAARQCERTIVPDLAPPLGLTDAGQLQPDLDIVLHARSTAEPLLERLRGATPPPDAVRLWFGPEGGFSDREVENLSDSGARLCQHGRRILRSETAAVAATAVTQTIYESRTCNDA